MAHQLGAAQQRHEGPVEGAARAVDDLRGRFALGIGPLVGREGAEAVCHAGNIRTAAGKNQKNPGGRRRFSSVKFSTAIKEQAMQRRLMVYPMGGTIDGRTGDHVLLAPP
jgi:hypothetical protein